MVPQALLEFCDFMSERFSKYFYIHDFIWFPDHPVRERTSLAYRKKAQLQWDWMLCPKSPWIRAVVRLWLPLWFQALSPRCLLACLCDIRLPNQKPCSLHRPKGLVRRNLDRISLSQNVLVTGEMMQNKQTKNKNEANQNKTKISTKAGKLLIGHNSS